MMLLCEYCGNTVAWVGSIRAAVFLYWSNTGEEMGNLCSARFNPQVSLFLPSIFIK